MVHRSLPQGSETRQVSFLCTKRELWAVGAGFGGAWLVCSECDRQKVCPVFFVESTSPFQTFSTGYFPYGCANRFGKRSLGAATNSISLTDADWSLSVQLKTTQMATFQNARIHTRVVSLSCQPARLAILLSTASVKQRYAVLVSCTFWNPPHTSACKYCRAERGGKKKKNCRYISLTTGEKPNLRVIQAVFACLLKWRWWRPFVVIAQ